MRIQVKNILTSNLKRASDFRSQLCLLADISKNCSHAAALSMNKNSKSISSDDLMPILVEVVRRANFHVLDAVIFYLSHFFLDNFIRKIIDFI